MNSTTGNQQQEKHNSIFKMALCAIRSLFKELPEQNKKFEERSSTIRKEIHNGGRKTNGRII